MRVKEIFKPLNAELNPICHLLALLGAHHILHISRIRVKYYFGDPNKQVVINGIHIVHSVYRKM